MPTINFNCFKLATKLPLGKIAAFFKIHQPVSWEGYLVLEDKHLEAVFKYSANSKQVYLFEFGCATFVNFNIGEIRCFIDYLKTLVDVVDNNLFAVFHESHSLEVNKDGNCVLWSGNTSYVKYNEYVTHIVSMVLAKSTALSQIEVEADNLLNEAEKFIGYLKKGWLRANTRKSAATIARILRFEYESITNIRIFDRFFDSKAGVASKEIYDHMAEHYELHDRFKVIKSKTNDLKRIVNNYSTLSYNDTERRLLIFEIFLLALFPISHVLMHEVYKFNLANIFKIFFR